MMLIEGQLLNPLEKPPFTREQLREYANVSGDMNPIHLDNEFAVQAGFPSVIVHGMISMGFLVDYLERNFPSEKYRIARIKVRFKKVNLPGDQLTCMGKIKKVTSKEHFLVSIEAQNSKGETTTEGEAEAISLQTS